MNFIDRGQQIINSYAEDELAAVKDLPIYLTRCFTPHTFNSFNFLTNCKNAEEFWKFADSQQEFRTAHYGSDLMGCFSKKELELINEISLDIGKLTKQFDRKTVPVGLNHQLSSVPTIRLLEQFRASNPDIVEVLEIGGGSGMLGHMCHRLGFKYTNFDITQSFYTFNSTVFETLYGEKFTDMRATRKSESQTLDSIADNEITLVPWWHFVNVQLALPRFQIVVMNHCFFEISKKAMAFIITRLSNAIEGRVYLLVSEWGATKFTELDGPFLQWLESEFDFRREPFDGHPNINPVGTVLLSFQKVNPELDVYTMPIDKRLNMIPSDNNFVTSKVRRLLSRYMAEDIKMVLRKILAAKAASRKSTILGNHYPLFSSNEFNLVSFCKSFEDLKGLIHEIEKEFGKPCFTEDEAFGFYISRKDHA